MIKSKNKKIRQYQRTKRSRFWFEGEEFFFFNIDPWREVEQKTNVLSGCCFVKSSIFSFFFIVDCLKLKFS